MVRAQAEADLMQKEMLFFTGSAPVTILLLRKLTPAQVLITSAALASYLNQPTLADAYLRNATVLKANFNNAFWVESLGMYRDNITTTLCPQDANSFAVLFNLTNTPAQAASISAGLEKNWNDLGPVAPELPDTISPFISGFEVGGFNLNNNPLIILFL
jgi:hypothetical protein